MRKDSGFVELYAFIGVFIVVQLLQATLQDCADEDSLTRSTSMIRYLLPTSTLMPLVAGYFVLRYPDGRLSSKRQRWACMAATALILWGYAVAFPETYARGYHFHGLLSFGSWVRALKNPLVLLALASPLMTYFIWLGRKPHLWLLLLLVVLIYFGSFMSYSWSAIQRAERVSNLYDRIGGGLYSNPVFDDPSVSTIYFLYSCEDTVKRRWRCVDNRRAWASHACPDYVRIDEPLPDGLDEFAMSCVKNDRKLMLYSALFLKKDYYYRGMTYIEFSALDPEQKSNAIVVADPGVDIGCTMLEEGTFLALYHCEL